VFVACNANEARPVVGGHLDSVELTASGHTTIPLLSRKFEVSGRRTSPPSAVA
jgi:hypothetical protein